MPQISSLKARQILDSRGNPTVEVDLWLADGSMGRAAVPSGASTGSREALELRDGGAQYLGKGVTTALNNITNVILPTIVNQEWTQKSLDDHMIALDGTPTKEKLGANAILAISMAFTVAEARSKKVPLYRHIADLTGTAQVKLPKPILNVMNGGAHANWTTDLQEYILFPMPEQSFAEHLRKSVEVFHHLGKLIGKKGLSTNVGNEGGYAPELSSNEEAFDLMLEAVKNAGYEMGKDKDFMMGIDGAATQFFADGVYTLKRDKVTKTSEEMVQWMVELSNKYPIFSLEDALAEDDWAGWANLTAQIGSTVQIVGDDLTVTNPQYINQALTGKNCNAVIIKLNQIGSVSETFEAIRLTKAAGWKSIVAHRSGETEDTFISHLVVGTASEQIKTGAPSRTDRTSKYNELLRIEEELNAA